MQIFGTTGQKFLPCPGTKGQRDKLKILPRDGTSRDSQYSGRDGQGQPKSRTGRGTKRDRAEKDVLKQENDIQNRKQCSKTGNGHFFEKFKLILSRFVSGRPVPW